MLGASAYELQGERGKEPGRRNCNHPCGYQPGNEVPTLDNGSNRGKVVWTLCPPEWRRHLALSMDVARKNIYRCKIYLKVGNPVQRASIGASAAGMATGAGSGLKVGDLGAAGLDIGGGAVSIPAVAVPAIVGCGCARCLRKAGKFVTERLHEHYRGNASLVLGQVRN